MNTSEIISRLPYTEPFLFVEELAHVDANGAVGSYTFSKDLGFYRGHFKDRPVTPGVILTECCAQIGLVCLGLYLLQQEGMPFEGAQIAMSSAAMDFLMPVFPDETVTVRSEKSYFRFNKLSCKVKMHNADGHLVCRGTLSGMVKTKAHG